MEPRRIGRISLDGINRLEIMDWGWELIEFLQFIPIRIDHDPASDTSNYTGVSPQFRLISVGELIPYYRIKIDNTGDEPLFEIKEISDINYDPRNYV